MCVVLLLKLWGSQDERGESMFLNATVEDNFRLRNLFSLKKMCHCGTRPLVGVPLNPILTWRHIGVTKVSVSQGYYHLQSPKSLFCWKKSNQAKKIFLCLWSIRITCLIHNYLLLKSVTISRWDRNALPCRQSASWRARVLFMSHARMRNAQWYLSFKSWQINLEMCT